MTVSSLLQKGIVLAKVTFLWLPVFLTPVSCLLHAHQGETFQPAGTPTRAPTSPPASISNPGQPIWNMKMDPEKQILTWEHWDNITDFECYENETPKGKSTSQVPGKSSFMYAPLTECQPPKNYSVHTIQRPQFSAFIMFSLPVGIQGAEAQNFRCRVHLSSLTCSWTVGPTAPPDIQYELYWQDLQKNKVHPCPNYTQDARGVHVGCDFKNITGATWVDGQHYFRVNGTSQEGVIPCTEIPTTALQCIEDLQAENLTFTCNGSDSKLTWIVDSVHQISFNFEVETRKDGEAPKKHKIDEKYLTLPNEENFEARIRVRSKSHDVWSAWGPSTAFACKTRLEGRGLGLWLPAGLGVLCALLAAVLARVIWSRSSVQQKLFPPIPQLRDLVKDADDLASDRLAAPKQDCVEDEEEVEIVRSP